MTEDLQLREVSGPPRHTTRTNGPAEHITLRRASGEVMGYICFNDDDDAAGWQARAGASPDAWNDADSWFRILRDSKARGIKPTEALEELFRAVNPRSHIVPGSLVPHKRRIDRRRSHQYGTRGKSTAIECEGRGRRQLRSTHQWRQ